MQKVKAVFKNAWPYQKDKLNLPVKNLEASIPFYTSIMKFQIVEQKQSPVNSAILERDGIQIGLSENGGDPSQDGCFFEVDDVNAAISELKLNGLHKEMSDPKMQRHGEALWKVFFVIAPDGLCYCIGERQY